ncbi:hypothetical protein M231_06164 [Tremella mesenterica]|uniref:Peptidase S54 rhomboid domain-containing protein n=2 Tax=Tremella mesenterica TaxID=5217 RepID=A0A4Q1BEJ4_TREME|nr:hypothetical protein M231_06164 [Tremella mesenterica]
MPTLRPIASSSRLTKRLVCPRAALVPNLPTTPRSCFSSNRLSTQRQALGRIIPRRIAVRISGPAGAGDGYDDLPRASIWRPIVFCLGLGGGAYVIAAQWTNHDTSKWMERFGAGRTWRWGQAAPSDRELLQAQRVQAAQEGQATVNTLRTRLSFLPQFILVPILRIYVITKNYALNSPPSQVTQLGLISVMGTVFLAWKIRRLEPFMKRWFTHRPVVLGGGVKREWANTVTLFTSVISHQSLPHLAFNSLALYGFGSAAYAYLVSPLPTSTSLPSSTHTPHFLAFLLAAGLFSSLSSHLWTNIFRLPRLLTTLRSPARISSAEALAAHQSILPSLGASGAIYAALTMTAMAFPDSHVSLIFLPFVSIPIGLGVSGMVALDLLGLIRGWRMFDHVAHLGGALFGVIYYKYGRELWTWTRRQLGGVLRT